MAQYNGYVEVPHGTFQEWRDATFGNGYNVDYFAGDQCWDYCALLWRQYGLTLYTGNGYARGCWQLMKDENARTPFIAINDVNQIKKGDCLVFGATPSNYAGHICFCDENFLAGSLFVKCLGQNQKGNGSGYPVTSDYISTASLIGAFRNTYWQGVEPEPEPEKGYNKHRYNFVLFNRRKRQEKWTKKPLKKR